MKLQAKGKQQISYKTILLADIYHAFQGSRVQGSLLFVTYTIIQGIIGSEMLVRTGPLNGKCKKEKIKHDNKIK